LRRGGFTSLAGGGFTSSGEGGFTFSGSAGEGGGISSGSAGGGGGTSSLPHFLDGSLDDAMRSLEEEECNIPEIRCENLRKFKTFCLNWCATNFQPKLLAFP
jgi:hypothetical protein